MTDTTTIGDLTEGERRAARFWNRTAHKYARTPIADEAAYQRKLELTRAELRPGARVLEFGCGTGSTALVHAPFVGEILAIDISARMIEIARGKAEAQGVTNVTFAEASLDSAGLPPASFDTVLGLSVLHLLPDWRRTLDEVFSLLKPGGVFVSSTACLADFMSFFKCIIPAGRAIGVFPHVEIFSEADLAAAIRAAGFEIETQWRPGRNTAMFVIARKPA